MAARRSAGGGRSRREDLDRPAQENSLLDQRSRVRAGAADPQRDRRLERLDQDFSSSPRRLETDGLTAGEPAADLLEPRDSLFFERCKQNRHPSAAREPESPHHVFGRARVVLDELRAPALADLRQPASKIGLEATGRDRAGGLAALRQDHAGAGPPVMRSLDAHDLREQSPLARFQGPPAEPDQIGELAHDERSSGRIGSLERRRPVAAKIALATAGATGGTGCSPKPVGRLELAIVCTSTRGISSIARTGKSR